MNFTAWILSVVGVVILTIMIDIVLPSGETNKYIKGISSILIVYMIVSPLPALVNYDFANSTSASTEQSMVDEDFIDYLYYMRCVMIEKEITKHLQQEGISNANVKIYANNNNGQAIINIVEINIQNIVIDSKLNNINIIDKVTQLVSKLCNLSIDKVRVYG